MKKINCTVALLTKNSASTLRGALESVKDFEEIIVCDDGSTDGTEAIAAEFGARIIRQDPAFLDEHGIRDFSGVRNQTYAAGSKDWFFYLDADEMLSAPAAAEIRDVVERATPGVYWMPRVYMIGNEQVTCSALYPNRQMRLMHRSLVAGFRKPVHERPEIKPDARISELTGALLVPADLTDAPASIRKMKRYIELDLGRRRMTPREFAGVCAHAAKAFARFSLFFIKNLPCNGRRLPLSSELRPLTYQWLLVSESFKKLRNP
jgi:glycosyltransferase involved in cell wall biosynthesis